jgi:hypothetical protein
MTTENTDTPLKADCPSALCSPSDYDAGLLNDFGGGDVGWWQDYIRAEIGRANEYWREIYNTEADEVELKSTALRELSKRNYQDAGTQAIAWNKLRDERDDARKLAAELRDLVPWSESEPWNFSWEND